MPDSVALQDFIAAGFLPGGDQLSRKSAPLRDLLKGPDDPVSAAARAAALAFAAFRDERASETEAPALWIVYLILALRFRWTAPCR
jgi:hypothetical protein